MNRELLKYVWQFMLLSVLQVLVFNNIHLGGYINPFPYIYLILILPIGIGRLNLLFISFLLGLVVDVFSNTGGMHAAATTLIGFYRPLFLNAQSPREGYELQMAPHIRTLGVGLFGVYTMLMVFIHHLALFYLEVFRFSEFFYTLLKVFASSFFTIIIIVAIELLFARERRR